MVLNTPDIVFMRNHLAVMVEAIVTAAAGETNPAPAQVAFADEWTAILVEASEILYEHWNSDAAFYALRAAAALALTPAQLRRVQEIAVHRRDEHLATPEGETAASVGAMTLAGPLTEATLENRYRDSYATLVDDIDAAWGWRRNPPRDWDEGFWAPYGWTPARETSVPGDDDDADRA